MAKSLDGLIEFLLEEIAISGERGLSFVELATSVQEFYIPSRRRRNAITEESRASILSGYATIAADRALLSRVWTWLAKHPDVSIGQDHKYDQQTLDDIEKQFPGYTIIEEHVRLDTLLSHGQTKAGTSDDVAPGALNNRRSNGPYLYVNEERISLTICGHLPDPTRVFGHEWTLLLHIAAAKHDGILQGALVKASGQDKRSVPKRTSGLQQKGYIEKQSLYVKGNKTSRLYLSRFARTSNTAESDVPTSIARAVTGTTSVAVPNQITIRHVAQQFFEILNNSPLVSQEDLGDTLGMTSFGKARILSQIVRYFARSGCVKRVKTAFGPAAQAQSLRVCIQFLREPKDADWLNAQDQGLDIDQQVELLASVHEAEPLNESAFLGGDVHDLPDEEQVEASLAGGELNETTRAVLPQWNPDRTLANVLTEAALQSGYTGVKNLNVRKIITGPFIRRLLESTLVKLSTRPLQAQPESLRHLAILRTQELNGSTLEYRHFAFGIYVDKVIGGRATWQAVSGGTQFLKDLHKAGQDESSIGKNPSRDSFGFAVQTKPPALLMQNGEVDMSQLLRDSKVRAIQLRKGEPVLRRTSAGRLEISLHGATEQISRDESPGIRLPKKASRRKPKPDKPLAPKQIRADGKSISGRPRKFVQGTEKFWRDMFSIIFQQQNPVQSKSFKRVGFMNDPQAMKIFRGRPVTFDQTILRAMNAGLPLPSDPCDISQEWIDRITAIMDRSQPGLYITPKGIMPSSKKKSTQKMIFRSARLNEIDWSDRQKTWNWQFVVSSIAHSMRHQRYYSRLDTDTIGTKAVVPKLSEASTSVGRPPMKIGNAQLHKAKTPLPQVPELDIQIQSTDQPLIHAPESEKMEFSKATSAIDHNKNLTDQLSIVRHTWTGAEGPISTSEETRKDAFRSISRIPPVWSAGQADHTSSTGNEHYFKHNIEDRRPTNIESQIYPTDVQATMGTESEIFGESSFMRTLTEAAKTWSTGFEPTIDPTLQTHASHHSPHSDAFGKRDHTANEGNDVERLRSAAINESEQLDQPRNLRDNSSLSFRDSATILATASRPSEDSDFVGQTNHQRVSDDLVQEQPLSCAQIDAGYSASEAISNPLKRTRDVMDDFSEDTDDNIDPTLQDETGPAIKRAKVDNTWEPRRCQISKLCRVIILELIGLCSGLAPNVPWTFRRAMTPRWQEAGVRMEQLTVKNVRNGIKTLLANGKLKQIIFAFRAKSGTMGKMSILALQSMEATSPPVIDLQAKMIDVEPADYIPSELEIETQRVPVELNKKRYAKELQQPQSRKAAKADQKATRQRRQTEPDRASTLTSNGLSKETSRSAANIGFLTLKVPRLGELNITNNNHFRRQAVFAPSRLDTGRGPGKDKAPNKGRSGRTPKTVRSKTSSEAPRIIWKKLRKSLLPSCLDDMPNIGENRDNAILASDNDPDFASFEAEVNCVSAWEHKLIDQQDEARTKLPIFINHVVPERAMSASRDPSRVEFEAMIEYPEVSGEEVAMPFPVAKSWPPFVSALSEGQNSILASAASVKDRRTRKPRKRKIDDDDDKLDEGNDDESAATPRKRRRANKKDHVLRKSHRNRALGEPNTDADFPSQASLFKRTRSTHVFRHLSEQAKYQIVVAVIVVRVLAGGIEKYIDWKIVKRLLPEHEDYVLKESWKTMLTRYRADITDLTENLQTRYIEALTEGLVPSIDFTAIYAADWEDIYSWALENLDKSIISSVDDLPATRVELLDRNDYDVAECKGMREIQANNANMTIPRKEEILSGIVFGKAYQTRSLLSPITIANKVLAEDEEDDESLVRAKSWVMATLLTPEDSFVPTEIRKKLLRLGKTTAECESLLDRATQALRRDRLIIRLKTVDPETKTAQLQDETRFEKFRRFEISSRFFEQFDMRRVVTLSMLQQAAAHKVKVLDASFNQGERIFLHKDTVLEDGEMVAVINLVAMGMLRIDAHDDVPVSRWGLEWQTHGYTTRLISKKSLGFSVTLNPIPSSYVYGDPLSPTRFRTPVPRGEIDQTDGMGRIPLWFDINHTFRPQVWAMVLSTLVGLVSVRPALDSRDISRTLSHALSSWEVQLVMDWCSKTGVVERSPGGSGWETTPWWWMCLGVDTVWNSGIN